MSGLSIETKRLLQSLVHSWNMLVDADVVISAQTLEIEMIPDYLFDEVILMNEFKERASKDDRKLDHDAFWEALKALRVREYCSLTRRKCKSLAHATGKCTLAFKDFLYLVRIIEASILERVRSQAARLRAEKSRPPDEHSMLTKKERKEHC